MGDHPGLLHLTRLRSRSDPAASFPGAWVDPRTPGSLGLRDKRSDLGKARRSRPEIGPNWNVADCGLECAGRGRTRPSLARCLASVNLCLPMWAPIAETAGLTSLLDVAARTEQELPAMHGVGPRWAPGISWARTGTGSPHRSRPVDRPRRAGRRGAVVCVAPDRPSSPHPLNRQAASASSSGRVQARCQ